MKIIKLIAATFLSVGLMASANAASYKVDVAGAHAFIQFKIKHLGYSWLLGRFNTFEGDFEYDAKAPEASSINIKIDVASVDSNHAERDKHLRGSDFLDVKKYPTATFKSTSYKKVSDTQGEVTGDFTFHGVTKSISFAVNKIGEGADPWGGYRVGFEGETVITLADYGIKNILGPASADAIIELYIEGIKQ